MKTREQINARKRELYTRPGAKERQADANNKCYLKRIGDDGECRPDYGIVFKSAAVQTTLTMWGGQ